MAGTSKLAFGASKIQSRVLKCRDSTPHSLLPVLVLRGIISYQHVHQSKKPTSRGPVPRIAIPPSQPKLLGNRCPLTRLPIFLQAYLGCAIPREASSLAFASTIDYLVFLLDVPLISIFFSFDW